MNVVSVGKPNRVADKRLSGEAFQAAQSGRVGQRATAQATGEPAKTGARAAQQIKQVIALQKCVTSAALPDACVSRYLVALCMWVAPSTSLDTLLG